MFKQGIEYERFYKHEIELELQRRNDWLPTTFILALTLSPAALVYLFS